MATARAILVNGREFSADDAARITIGRDEASDVQLDHDIVSRHHATLTVDDRGWVFRDAGTTNGSFLDGRRVSELVVTSDVRLVLGSVDDGVVLALQLVAPQNPAETRVVALAPAGATPLAPATPPEVLSPSVGEPVFSPTHRAHASGMATWDSPDPNRPRGPELSPGLEVMVGETRGEWAHITCSNGWAAWVDRRLLVPGAEPAAEGQ